MNLKTYNPTTPSQRGRVAVDKTTLWKGKPLKSLTKGGSSTGGRNCYGRITLRHRGGGHKRKYRLIDFKRQKYNEVAVVERIEYDPNRSAFIALIKYGDGEYSYILAPHGLTVGDKVSSGPAAEISIGNALPLKFIPIGSVVHNIELKPKAGGQLVRSAGGAAHVVGRDAGFVQVKLASGEVRLVHNACMATIGGLSNPDQKNIKIGKAGRSRWLGRRPSVRGVAKNPVDHPHGGGEGRTSGGRHPCTPWGKPTKGYKTRPKRKSNKHIVRKRA